MRGRAVSQIQVDQALIQDTSVLQYCLEIADRFLIKADRDLLLKLGCVRVVPGCGEVIFFAHVTPFTGRILICFKTGTRPERGVKPAFAGGAP